MVEPADARPGAPGTDDDAPRARRRDLRWRVAAGVGALAALGAGVLLAPDADAPPGPPASSTPTTVPAPGAPYETLASSWEHTPSPPVEPAVLDGLAFTDVTAEAGLQHPHLLGVPEGAEDMSGGAAVGDYDGDGDLDLYLTRVGAPHALYRNDGDGTFTDVAGPAGVAGDGTAGGAGAVWADVDGDGDLDLFVSDIDGSAPALFLNDGDGRFTDEAGRRGVVPEPAPGEAPGGTFSGAFTDWDLDGDLDLVVVEWYTAPVSHLADAPGAGNDQCARAAAVAEGGFAVADGTRAARTRLLENDGGARFTDVTAAMGLDPASTAAFGVIASDHDGDGWPDLFVSGDFCTSRLLRNEGGERFVDVAGSTGAGTDENGMGQVVEDLDGDGVMDWFLSSISLPPEQGTCPAAAPTVGCTGNRAYLGTAAGTFRDATDALGVRDAFWGWGVVAQDLTNTGRRDLVVTSGWADPNHVAYDLARPEYAVWSRSTGSPTRLWRNTGAGPWPDVAEQVGVVDRGNGKALVAFDVEGDGDLDLLKVNTEAPPVLYRNDTPTGAGHHWARVRLRDGGTANTRGIGARVTTVTAGGRRVVSEVRAGGSFQSGDPDEVHVGLGTEAGPVAVEVLWPGADAVEAYTVDADTTSTLVRGEGR